MFRKWLRRLIQWALADVKTEAAPQVVHVMVEPSLPATIHDFAEPFFQMLPTALLEELDEELCSQNYEAIQLDILAPLAYKLAGHQHTGEELKKVLVMVADFGAMTYIWDRQAAQERAIDPYRELIDSLDLSGLRPAEDDKPHDMWDNEELPY